MNKIKLCIISGLVLVFFSSCADEKSTPADYFDYEQEAEEIVITGFSDKGEDAEIGNLVIPSKIKGKNVVLIDSNAFRAQTNFTSVKIPKTVREIETCAFAETVIESVTFENGVESIGMGAFIHCDYLNEITLPESVHYIGIAAFYCPNLTDIYINGDENSEPIITSRWDNLHRKSTIMDNFRISESQCSSDVEWFIHDKLEFSNPIIYGLFDFPENKTELEVLYGLDLNFPLKKGQQVTITGDRPIKANCYYCGDEKYCKLRYVTNTSSAIPKSNGFQVFVCNKCSKEKGLR